MIFLGTSLGSKNHSKNRSRHRGSPQFKNMCGHTCLQGVAKNCSRRCKTMETQRYAKPRSRTRGNNRNLHYFSPGGKNFADKTTPVLGSVLAQSPGHKQIKLRLSEWTPFWGPFLDTKTGVVLSAKLLSPSEKKAQISIVSSCARQKFPIPLGFHGFAAPRVLVLHTLRTFMSTHVLEQFKNMCGHTCLQGVANNCSWRCQTMETQRYAKPRPRIPAETIETCTIFRPAAKILPTKRPPFWGPKTDPKTGAKSPGHKQMKLRLSEWTRLWGPFLDTKPGVVLSAKLLSPSEKKAQVSIVSSCTRQKFPIPLGFHGFAAPRVLVLHTLRTFMSTHVLELFKNMCGHTCLQGVANNCSWRCKTMETQRYAKPRSRARGNNRNLHYFSPGGKNFADKTTPVLGSKNGPQNGGQVARTQVNQIE